MGMVLVSRMVRAARLDPSLYEEVEADRRATGRAAAGVVGAGGGWLIWALLTYAVGAKLFPEPETRSDLGELFRTIGFASAPGVVRVFGLIPGPRDGGCLGGA